MEKSSAVPRSATPPTGPASLTIALPSAFLAIDRSRSQRDGRALWRLRSIRLYSEASTKRHRAYATLDPQEGDQVEPRRAQLELVGEGSDIFAALAALTVQLFSSPLLVGELPAGATVNVTLENGAAAAHIVIRDERDGGGR